MAVIALMSDLSNRTTANSYQTLAQAETYWETQRDRSDLLRFDEEEIERALVTAATLLNGLPWNGSQSVSTATLSFPRNISVSRSAPGNFSGRTYSLDEEDPVPQVVTNMQAELAYHLLQNEGLTSDTGGLSASAGLSVGSVELTSLRDPALIPSFIRNQLRMFLRAGGSNQVFVGG